MWRSENLVLKLQYILGSYRNRANGESEYLDPRDIVYTCDVVSSSMYVQYNILTKNCASFVEAILSPWNVSCRFPLVRAINIPNCRANAEGEEEKETLLQGFLNYYQERVLDKEQILADIEHITKDNLTVYIARNLSNLSWHVGLLCKWTKPGNNPCYLSMCGWPYDTINTAAKARLLLRGKFTVCFPDPCVRLSISTDNISTDKTDKR